MQRPGGQPPAVSEDLVVLQVEIRSGLTAPAETRTAVVEWNGYFLLAHAVHSSADGFPKLHPRSLLERR
jgi:hypothetical protein